MKESKTKNPRNNHIIEYYLANYKYNDIGVIYCNLFHKWRAQIVVDEKCHYINFFDTKEEALKQLFEKVKEMYDIQ